MVIQNLFSRKEVQQLYWKHRPKHTYEDEEGVTNC